MAEAPVNPSITEHAVPSITEYAEAGDGDSTVTTPGKDSQRSSAASDSGILFARRKSEQLRKAERWVSEGDWRARKSCTIL